MSSVKFIGQQTLKTGIPPEILPAASPSGVWHGWEMPSGQVMVQALNDEMHPEGPLYPLDSELFTASFVPFAPQKQVRTLNASSPDLIFFWYEQMMLRSSAASQPQGAENTPHSGQQPAAGTPPPVSPAPEATAEPAELAPLDIRVDYGEHINFKDEELDDSPYSLADELSGAPEMSAQGMSAPNPYYVEPTPTSSKAVEAAPLLPTAQPVQSPQAAAPAPVQENPALTEMKQALRNEFNQVLNELSSKGQSEAADHMMQLLGSPGFTKEEMHFLYTEFGLALRREKQYELSLLCHLQALRVAPDDERVLFNLARTEFELGDIDKSREYLAKSLEVAPEFVIAKNFLYFLDGGK